MDRVYRRHRWPFKKSSTFRTLSFVIAMKVPLLHLLVAAGSRPRVGNTWFIDGYNLLGHKGTPKDATVLAEKLKPIRADAVILVFDGPKEGSMDSSIAENGSFKNVVLGQAMSADKYIMDEIKAMRQIDQTRRVQVVTADRQLRSAVLDIKPIVKGVVNPSTFWRRYLPRLCGMKLPKAADVEAAAAADGGDDNDAADEL
jgi:YacP-like NYN domain